MTASTKPCEHMNFIGQVNVYRLSDVEGGPITGFTTGIEVKCADCGLPFRFKGIPFGSHPAEPRLRVDGEELRAPIEPAYARSILGRSEGGAVTELSAASPSPVYEAPRDPAVHLRVRGVGRVADEPRALLLALNERPTDDEIRALHDHLSEVVIA